MKRILLQWVLPFALTISLLALAFSLIEKPEEIPGYIAGVPLYVHVLFVLVTLVSFWLRAVRWRVLLPDQPLTSKTCFSPLMIGFMMNSLFPARAGEFARAVVLGRKAKMPFTHVLGSVLLERIFDGVVLLACFAVILNLLGATIPEVISLPGSDWSIRGETVQGGVLKASIMVLILLAGAVTLLFPAVRRLFEKVAHTVLPTKLGNFAVDQLEKLVQGFRSLHSPKVIVLVVFWTLAVWATVALSLQVGAWGFPELAEMSFLQAWAVSVFVCIFILLPAAPGYWGLYELGVIAACLTLGLTESAEVALSYSVVVHLWQIVITIVCGLYFSWSEGVKLGQLREEDEEAAPQE